tara:strand:- start:190 stop:435 length:246 start_codon:yes stop_codon:yes gene_type:complete
MKISKRQLKRIIREEKRKLQEAGDIYPRPQHPMIANAGENTRQEMIDLITDLLMNGTGLTPVACESSAEEIVNQLHKAGYC